MSWKNILYLLLVVVIAAGSALAGALAGGAIVYRNLQQPSGALPVPLQEIIPAGTTPPPQTLTLNEMTWKPPLRRLWNEWDPQWSPLWALFPGR